MVAFLTLSYGFLASQLFSRLASCRPCETSHLLFLCPSFGKLSGMDAATTLPRILHMPLFPLLPSSLLPIPTIPTITHPSPSKPTAARGAWPQSCARRTVKRPAGSFRNPSPWLASIASRNLSGTTLPSSRCPGACNFQVFDSRTTPKVPASSGKVPFCIMAS